MTLGLAKIKLRQVGMTLTRKDGEYRVNIAGGKEATAYYTDDIEDALNTGLAIAKHGSIPKHQKYVRVIIKTQNYQYDEFYQEEGVIELYRKGEIDYDITNRCYIKR